MNHVDYDSKKCYCYNQHDSHLKIVIFSRKFRNFNFLLATLNMHRENDFSHAIGKK